MGPPWPKGAARRLSGRDVATAAGDVGHAGPGIGAGGGGRRGDGLSCYVVSAGFCGPWRVGGAVGEDRGSLPGKGSI